ncbi:uncharacterized protein LOC141577058 isoform X2 [Camelus bactrianus]|uniref:Uncharacterized protein LOC141577058 isoform X2 n=1 Tax=Camelus bactrianus TaxID=9837 RepID=A0AC58Q2C5_CAMBA
MDPSFPTRRSGVLVPNLCAPKRLREPAGCPPLCGSSLSSHNGSAAPTSPPSAPSLHFPPPGRQRHLRRPAQVRPCDPRAPAAEHAPLPLRHRPAPARPLPESSQTSCGRRLPPRLSLRGKAEKEAKPASPRGPSPRRRKALAESGRGLREAGKWAPGSAPGMAGQSLWTETCTPAALDRRQVSAVSG